MMAPPAIFMLVNTTTEKRREEEGFTAGALSRFTKENGAMTRGKVKVWYCIEMADLNRETSELETWKANPRKRRLFQLKKLRKCLN